MYSVRDRGKMVDLNEIEQRLKGMREELEIIKSLNYLSFDCKDKCYEWYEKEIKILRGRLDEYIRAIKKGE